jgi:hypothetical protein
MLFLKIIAFFPLMFAFPDLRVNWSGGQLNAVRVVAEGKDEVMEQCVKSGLEVRYRYELRICKRRFLWADSCNDPKVEVHSLQYDPISESYRVMVDKIGDNEAAKTTTAKPLWARLLNTRRLRSPTLATIRKNIPKVALPIWGCE